MGQICVVQRGAGRQERKIGEEWAGAGRRDKGEDSKAPFLEEGGGGTGEEGGRMCDVGGAGG